MSVPAAVAAGTESGGEPQNDLLKYVLIAGGATAVAVAIAYVLFGGGEKDKKKKKKATAEPKVTPSKAQPTETKVVMEDLPEDDDEVRLKTSAVRKLKPAATNVSYCVCL